MNKKIYDKWIDPDDFARLISTNYKEDIWTYLKSSQHHDIKNSKSIIALFPCDEIVNEDVEYLVNNKIKNDYNDNYSDNYLSLLSYEYSRNIEDKYSICDKNFIDFPNSIFVKFSLIYEFLHDSKQIIIYYEDEKYIDKIEDFFANDKFLVEPVKVNKLKSNFTYKQYKNSINEIKEKIREGVLYQTNLTRKFFGNFKERPKNNTALNLFLDLSNCGPANYSCFIKYRQKFIISNSPELFVKSEKGAVTSTPIKGTSPRSKNPIIDYFNKKYLINSDKERAENLMIVDLVRNDLSPFSKAGSVCVDNLFKVDSYSSYHHLSSKVKSALKIDKNISHIIKSCFPPASMTGTPKIQAVNVVKELERLQRGIYSGSIGFITGKKELQLSVVIRTLIIDGDKFEFQVGGGITIDSNADKEIEETFVKAASICKILKIKSLQNVTI